MQDLDRGLIVGTTSFGKGLAQNVVALPFTTGLKITTSRFYLPSGRNIQALDYRLHGTRVPDSLRSQFTSSNGRLLRGGGGVEPDIDMRMQEGPVEESLRRSGAFFHYAREFAADGAIDPTEMSPASIDMDAFSDWLSDGDFRYESQERLQLEALRATLSNGSDTATGAAAVRELTALERVIEERERSAIRAEEAILRHAVFEAVVRQSATAVEMQYTALLAYDPAVAAALAIVQDVAGYSALLRP